MKIKEIRAFEIATEPKPVTNPRSPSRAQSVHMNRPMGRYERYPNSVRHVSFTTWKRPAVLVTAEDGTQGFGLSLYAPPVTRIINEHFGPNLIGENAMATEKLWDMMVRLSTAFSPTGMTSYAISALDVALWDLKGKLLGLPVYELLGGPQKEKIFCYASGFDQAWYMELGFRATKLFSPWGPEDGLEGLNKLEELVASTRETIGDDVELMLDAWTGYDSEFTVRVAERDAAVRSQMARGLHPAGRSLGVRVNPATPALADAGDRRALVQSGPVRRGRGQTAGRHFPARCALVRWHYSSSQDLSPGPGKSYFGNCPRRHELPIRPTSVDGDACSYLGRTVGGGVFTGRALGGDGQTAWHSCNRGWVCAA